MKKPSSVPSWKEVETTLKTEASFSSTLSGDDAFRREIEVNDAAFMKRLTEQDAIFRAKLDYSNRGFLV